MPITGTPGPLADMTRKQRRKNKLSKTGKQVAARDHAGYFGSLVSPQFNAYGDANPFGQFLATTALADVEQGYTNALYRKPKLRFDNYMKRLGAGATPGALAPIGTGQAIDTGNPFTSSSGVGFPTMDNRLGGNAPGSVKKPKLGPTRFSTLGTAYTDQLRREWLALSPTERGEGQAVPGRWSPWG